MTPDEWESLCDGCGRCCLLKFEDGEGEVAFTDVRCRLQSACGACSNYPERLSLVDECMVLTPAIVREGWLPRTCAYRLIEEGKPLYPWHPLVSGTSRTVIDAGISISAHRTRSEIAVKDPETRFRKWPNR